jgi:hypothetical protein
MDSVEGRCEEGTSRNSQKRGSLATLNAHGDGYDSGSNKRMRRTMDNMAQKH